MKDECSGYSKTVNTCVALLGFIVKIDVEKCDFHGKKLSTLKNSTTFATF
jgi:hypothetical protein